MSFKRHGDRNTSAKNFNQATVPIVFSWDVTPYFEYLIVGGGGGGGYGGGGGGGGGVQSNILYNINGEISNSIFVITVAAAGAGSTVATSSGSTGGRAAITSLQDPTLDTDCSILFDGYDNYLQVVNTTAIYQLGGASKSFTMEMWHYYQDANFTAPVQQPTLINYVTAFAANSIYVGKHPSYQGRFTFWSYNLNTAAPILLDTTVPETNTWIHYAIVRNGNNFNLYKNGTNVCGYSSAGSITGVTATGGQNFFIGTGANTSIQGYLSNFRIVQGNAIYRGDFTVPTSALTAVANTVLLTCRANTLIDESPNNWTIYANGSPVIRVFNPFVHASTLVSQGGGGGASGGTTSSYDAALSGGSGGGGGWGSVGANAGNTKAFLGGYSIKGQGYPGGAGGLYPVSVGMGGGGGGAGGKGGTGSYDTYLTSSGPAAHPASPGGDGGIGFQSFISGSNLYYGGGGGGGAPINPISPERFTYGGLGGGGDGSLTFSGNVGIVNTGGGGGSGNIFIPTTATRNGIGGNGGSGIVILRYPDKYGRAYFTTGSPNVTYANANIIYRFWQSGTIQFKT